MISTRRLAVLEAVVQEHIAASTPIGSKTIVEKYDLGVSAATVRGDMSYLEEQQLIAPTHTSSGRVPTEKGYRAYVDHLLSELEPLAGPTKASVEADAEAKQYPLNLPELLECASDLEELTLRLGRLISELSSQATIVQLPSPMKERLLRVEILPLSPQLLLVMVITHRLDTLQSFVELEGSESLSSEELSAFVDQLNRWLSGLTLSQVHDLLFQLKTGDAVNSGQATAVDLTSPAEGNAVAFPTENILDMMLRLLEEKQQYHTVLLGTAHLAATALDFGDRLSEILTLLEDRETLRELLSRVGSSKELIVSIGNENQPLDSISVIASKISISDLRSVEIGLIGPVRMRYRHNISLLRRLVYEFSELVGR